MDEVTYSTKVWGGEWLSTLNRHKDAQLIIGNNLDRKFIDMGKVSDIYHLPELKAVKECKTKYILWYSGDVYPPNTNWILDAIPLLEKYQIATCRWERGNLKYHKEHIEEVTDFGWTTFLFSDQCYIARTEFMQQIDYNTVHPIAEFYPEHGGNSFERRVAQYLAKTKTPMAVLDNHFYTHINSEDKKYEN